MELEQYELMAVAEDQHWWYVGLRDAITQCLQHRSIRLPSRPSVLDAGCGTGANLLHLSNLLTPQRLAGFDTSEEALRLASQKVPNADLYQSDICDPELRDNSFDLILSCDVLYVVGIGQATRGLQKLCRALNKDGIFIWNLPAYNWMASYHDRVVHTKQRFTRGTLENLCRTIGLECICISYRLCALLPFVLAKRFAATALFGVPRQSDLVQPSPGINRLLLRYLQMENKLIANGHCLPWGSSVFAVCRKKC
jgi:SAM-dependent methyltransferase